MFWWKVRYTVATNPLSNKVIIGNNIIIATNLICDKPYTVTNVIRDKSYNAKKVIRDKHNNLTKATNAISDKSCL